MDCTASVDLLQRHLSPEEFETLFKMTRAEFYRLPEFKRNDEKMRVGLWSSEDEKGGRASVAGVVYWPSGQQMHSCACHMKLIHWP